MCIAGLRATRFCHNTGESALTRLWLDGILDQKLTTRGKPMRTDTQYFLCSVIFVSPHIYPPVSLILGVICLGVAFYHSHKSNKGNGENNERRKNNETV